jgi:hypothetical protein
LSWDELTEQETLDIETKVLGVYNWQRETEETF